MKANSHLTLAVVVALVGLCSVELHGQTEQVATPQQMQAHINQLESEVAQLRAIVQQLEARLPAAAEGNSLADPAPQTAASNQLQAEDQKTLDALRSSTVNVAVDTYYAYNFNH